MSLRTINSNEKLKSIDLSNQDRDFIQVLPIYDEDPQEQGLKYCVVFRK